MNRIRIAACVFFLGAAVPLWGQNPAAKTSTLRPRPRAISQRATTNKGLQFHHERHALPLHSALQFDVRGLQADEHPSDDQFAALVQRMRSLQKVVLAAMQPVQGSPPATFQDAVIDKAGKFTPGTFQINRAPFPGDQKFFRVHHSQNLALIVAGGDTSHPLHIHVNPVRLPADPERGTRGQPTCEYWTDTILLQPNVPTNVMLPLNHWTGDAVVHCHILDHEDAGMMTLIDIRPDVLSWPEFPLGKMMDLPHIPKATVDNLNASWPKAGAPIAVNDSHKVTVFFFMPAGANGSACAHCSKSVQTVAKFRNGLSKGAAIRVVAVSATDVSALPDPAALGLRAENDVLCSDLELRSFEPLGLIDATPELNADGEVSFPHAFVPNSRRLIWPWDAMHGLFNVDANGMVVSVRRGFSAFEDTSQIMREVQLAALGHDQIRAAFDQAAATPKSRFASRRLEIDRTRFEQRVKTFQAMLREQ